MCAICSAINLPACSAATCNPIVIYEGASFAATQTTNVIHIVLGTVAGVAVPAGLWLRKKMRRYAKPETCTDHDSRRIPKTQR